MAEIEFSGNQVIIRIQKAILVLTKAQFIEALRHGKAYRRRQNQSSLEEKNQSCKTVR
jgi:hypothetical protein